MSVDELKEYEEQKEKTKNQIIEFLRENPEEWVSEKVIKNNLDIDFNYIEIDEALTGEYWSVRKRIENKSAKIKKDGYYEWVDFYRYKPFVKSRRFWVIILLAIVILIVITFHLFRI